MPRVSKTAQVATALSQHQELQIAVEQAASEVSDKLDAPADLVFAFVSGHRTILQNPQTRQGLIQGLSDASQNLGTDQILGCTAESIVHNQTEVEFLPAVSLWAARLPNVNLDLMHLGYQRQLDGGAFVGWPEQVEGEWPAGSFLIMLADPYSFPTDVLLSRLNQDRPGVRVVGGMASGGDAPRSNSLLYKTQVLDQGCVAARVHGDIALHTIVSQGCRAVGQPYVITDCQRNAILELGGQPALTRLRELYAGLPPDDRDKLQQGLHIGRLVDEYIEEPAYGDFLIRNLIGFQEQQGSILASDFFRKGQTIQFHIRDEQSAHIDLQTLLSEQSRDGKHNLIGGLAFSCNGRGSRMFQTPNHDAQLIQSFLGPLPIAGFFAAGEIGPVAGQNFVHGFTNSLALLERLN